MIGVIADDVTGATDVAAFVKQNGLRTLLVFGETSEIITGGERFDAVVVALKSRNLPADVAVAQSSEALERLRAAGADRFYFKYCSTFDSTATGNIGPVSEALAAAVGEPLVVTTPGSPDHGRTVYRGHLFVGDTLLAESHMRHHPVTPMTDSSVVRMLQAQSIGRVGSVTIDVIRGGVDAVRTRIRELRMLGVGQAVADATSADDLATVAEACRDLRFTAGAAGLITAISALVGAGDAPTQRSHAREAGKTAIIAGSCSARTLEQIAVFDDRYPGESYRLDSETHPDEQSMSEAALSWFDSLDDEATPLIYSSLPPEGLAEVHERIGVQGASALFERAAGEIARGLVERGVTRLVAAGGETSGAIISAVGVRIAEVGDEAATGVPWIHARDRALSLALKSGNFGEPDFLLSVRPYLAHTLEGNR